MENNLLCVAQCGFELAYFDVPTKTPEYRGHSIQVLPTRTRSVRESTHRAPLDGCHIPAILARATHGRPQQFIASLESEPMLEATSLRVTISASCKRAFCSVAEFAKRWPQIDFDGVPWSVYEPDSGFLAACRGCEAVLDAFLKVGGQYRQTQAAPGRITAHRMEGISIDTGEVMKADFYVFAPGPWLGSVFPFLKSSILTTRQEVFFFDTPAGDLRFTEEHLSTWIESTNLTAPSRSSKLLRRNPSRNLTGPDLAEELRR